MCWTAAAFMFCFEFDYRRKTVFYIQRTRIHTIVVESYTEETRNTRIKRNWTDFNRLPTFYFDCLFPLPLTKLVRWMIFVRWEYIISIHTTPSLNNSHQPHHHVVVVDVLFICPNTLNTNNIHRVWNGARCRGKVLNNSFNKNMVLMFYAACLFVLVFW